MFIRINPYLCHLLTRYQSTIFPNHKSCVRKKGVPKRRTLLQIKSYPLHETCRLSRPPSPATDRGGNEDGNYNERLGRRMRQGLPSDDRFDPCNSLVATEAGETFRASTVHEEGDVEIHIAGQNLKTRSLSTMDFVSSQRFTGVKIRHKNKVPLCDFAERHLRGLKRTP